MFRFLIPIKCAGLILTLMGLSYQSVAQRIYGGFYTADKLKNSIENCRKYDWAIQLKNSTLQKAAVWKNKTDDALWAMVPAQDVPRTIDVTLNRAAREPKVSGCLNCGNDLSAFGNYPYIVTVEKHPWKIECPVCHALFPTNDFEKYYKSGINKKGVFDSSIADKKLLFNTAHPDVQDPLHQFGVDDGWGYNLTKDKVYRFVGYYNWKQWNYIIDGLSLLSDAWLYSGDTVYAHKAAILLDRIADVYPDMDWAPYAKKGWYHSDGGGGKGKIGGSIWETGLVTTMALSYDKILSGTLNDAALFAFLSKKAKAFQLPSKKGSRELWVHNIDQNILLTIFDAVMKEDIRGNQGMHQLSVAAAAIALNTQPETNKWLNWLFEPLGGAIPGIMLTRFNHDGTSDEGAPGYALMLSGLITQTAALLHGYNGYTAHDILMEFPQLRAGFMVACNMLVAGKSIPNQGDSGATGLVSSSGCNPAFVALGFWLYKDAELGLLAYTANGNKGKGLHAPVYTSNPEALSSEIEAIGKKNHHVSVASRLLSGHGYAILETGGKKNPTGLIMNYGRSINHAHPDQLNIDLFSFGKWLAPDHGYPEYATKWPSNEEWTGTTLSHNLVLVNQKPQKENWTGHTKLFQSVDGFSAVTVSAPDAYPGIEKYERTLLLIGGTKTDTNSYVVDFFNVKGGNDHLLSFHGPPGTMTTTGLQLRQEPGTYAGPDVPKGAWAKGFPVGYSHLYAVQKDSSPAKMFTINWRVSDQYRPVKDPRPVQLKLHVLTPVNDVAVAKGDPPQNKAGNPKNLDYILLHKNGKDLNSVFVSILEPYVAAPFIKNARQIAVDSSEVTILEIENENGTIDYIIKNNVGGHVSTKEIQLEGTIAWLHTRKGKLLRAVLIDMPYLKYKGFSLKGLPSLTGKVLDMNKKTSGEGWILVDRPLPESVTGQYILINNKTNRDAAYLIKEVAPQGKNTRLNFGPLNFVSGFKGPEVNVRKTRVPQTYDLGYEYEFGIGDAFEISQVREIKK